MFKLRSRQHPLFVEEEIHFRRSPPRLRLRFVLLLILVALCAWAWQRAQAQEGDWDDIDAGQLLLTTEKGERLHQAVNLDSRVHIKVSGMVAHVSLQQQFRNDSPEWVEGVYVFPLPEKSAVNKMRVVMGERVIEGLIKEKTQALNIYRQAKQAGKRAGLVSQQRPNLFSTKIANIGPYETVSVSIEYIETVAYDSGRFALRFPMTITPRYIPGRPLPEGDKAASVTEVMVDSALGWAVNTDQVVDASEITPWLIPQVPSESNPLNPITITAELDAGMPLAAIDSAYHGIISSRQDNRYQLRLAQGPVSMVQDFVLSWQPVSGYGPRAAVFSEEVDGEHYAVLMMLPPVRAQKTLPKEAVYVIDTSGSMDGVSIRQARQSLLFAMQQLGPDDHFNVIAFNSHTQQLFAGAVPASGENIARASHFVSQLRSGGGTEMMGALQAALSDNNQAFNELAEEPMLRQVIFITDGAVGNEQALLERIYQQLGSSRLYTVGIGSAPNTHFMRKAAQFGRGTYTYIGRAEEVATKMRDLINKLNHPVASNIHVQWPGHRVVESYPQRLPDLYHGEPIIVAAKLRDIRGDIIVQGTLADKSWQQTLKVDAAGSHQGVATLWAREKIADLLDQKTTGADPQEIRDKVLDVALTHRLVSPYSSFVAVEESVSRAAHNALKTHAVTNARPKGQGAQAYAFPQTATGAEVGLYWGATMLLMAWVLRFALIREERYELV